MMGGALWGPRWFCPPALLAEAGLFAETLEAIRRISANIQRIPPESGYANSICTLGVMDRSQTVYAVAMRSARRLG